jgi:hypothetical protein
MKPTPNPNLPCKPIRRGILLVLGVIALMTLSLPAASAQTGPTGPTGPIGPTGGQGEIGTKGPKGDPGRTGASGVQGPQGIAGADGATGATGPQGSTGAQGPQGIAGANGATGAKGDTGAAGANGAQGATGSQGSQGVAGANGATGAQGANGATGGQGVAGANGATGATGNQGVAGPNGATGATGSQGPQGSAGATGATGAAGSPGPAGVNGLPGAAGAGSLIAQTPEAAGSNCIEGGTRVTSGPDTNANGVLDPAEVTATTFVCNGPPQPQPIAGCGTAPLSFENTQFAVTAVDPDPNSPGPFSDPNNFGQRPNVGGLVSITANVVNPNIGSCGTVPVTNKYFAWTLFSTPPGSKVVLGSSTDPVAQFQPDVAGTYKARLVVTDSLGNQSPPAFVTVWTTTCGANPITLAGIPGSSTIGPYDTSPSNYAQSVANISCTPGGPPPSNPGSALVGLAYSVDSDRYQCPVRFTPTFDYRWSIVSVPAEGLAAQLSTVTGNGTVFTGIRPGDFYQVELVVHDSNGASTTAEYFIRVVQPPCPP